eukprot:403368074
MLYLQAQSSSFIPDIKQLRSPASIPQQQQLNPIDGMMISSNGAKLLLKSYDTRNISKQIPIKHQSIPITEYQIRPPIKYQQPSYSQPNIFKRNSQFNTRKQSKDNNKVKTDVNSHSLEELADVYQKNKNGVFDGKRYTIKLDIQSVIQTSEEPIFLENHHMTSTKSHQNIKLQSQQRRTFTRIHSQSLQNSQSKQEFEVLQSSPQKDKPSKLQNQDNQVPSATVFHNYIFKEAILKPQLQDTLQDLKSLENQDKTLLKDIMKDKLIINQTRNHNSVKTFNDQLKQKDLSQLIDKYEEEEVLMNNQIDVNKLTLSEQLSKKIQNDVNQPKNKKQLLFLKRQLDEHKNIERPLSSKQQQSIVFFHPPLSNPIKPPSSNDQYKKQTWLQLKKLEKEIKDNSLWFSEDKYQQLRILQDRNKLHYQKLTTVQRILD